MMKKSLNYLLLSATLGLGFTMPAQAVEGLSANIGVTSNYLWRGLEQTNGKAAISGGIDYEAQSGFYAGTWVSNADWDTDMTYELDLYLGFSGSIEDVSYDVGFIQYAYPDSTPDVDFSEAYINLTFGAFTLGYATLVDAEGADFGDDSYISLDAEFELASEIGLSLHVGTGTDDFYAGESFVDYGFSLSKSDFSLGFSKTDLDEDDLKVYVSYSLSFDL